MVVWHTEDELKTNHKLNYRNTIDSLEKKSGQLDSSSQFNFATFDNRKAERFLQNNQTEYVGDSIIDGEIDFTIFIMRKGTTSGAASLSYLPANSERRFVSGTDTFYIVNNCFFGSGSDGNSNIMRHEIAHATDRMPHANTVNNGVLGKHFYNDFMWGEMNGDHVFYTANGWERWRRGWMNNVYSVEGDQDSVDIILDDFITKGEAVKIKIPGTSPAQYLWLENHQGISVFDKRDSPFYTNKTTEKGIYAYVSTLYNDTTTINKFNRDEANGFKALHADGNHDFKIINEIIHDPNIFHNTRHDFTIVEENPMGPVNKFTNYRGDLNTTVKVKDGVINYNDNANRDQERDSYTRKVIQNEFVIIGKIDGNVDNGLNGVGAPFTEVGQNIVGISNNPVLTPHQFYTRPAQRLSTIPINGVEVKIIALNDGVYTLRVYYNKTKITKNQRFTGELGLIDLSSAPWDLEVEQGKQLRIDKSGTPNRQTLGDFDSAKGQFQYPDFVTPTIFTASDSGKILIHDGAEILVQNGSSFILKSDALLEIEGSGQLRVEKGAYFCVESGAVINLLDSAKINLPNIDAIGINPLLSESTTIECMSLLQLDSAINGNFNSVFLADAGSSQNRCASDTGYSLGPDSLLTGTLRWSYADGSSASAVLSDTSVNNPRIVVALDSTTTFKLTVVSGGNTDEDFTTVTILEEETAGLVPNGSFEVDVNTDSIADGWQYYHQTPVNYATDLTSTITNETRLTIPAEKGGCHSLYLPLIDTSKVTYIAQEFSPAIALDTNEVYIVLADVLINQTGTVTPPGDFDLSFYIETEEIAKTGGATYQHNWNLSGEHSAMFDLKKGWHTYSSYFVAGNAFSSSDLKAIAVGIQSNVENPEDVETYIDNIRFFKLTDVNASSGTNYYYIRRGENTTTTPTYDPVTTISYYDKYIYLGFGDGGHYGKYSAVFLHEQNPNIVPNWNSKARYIYINNSVNNAEKFTYEITNTLIVPQYVDIQMQPNLSLDFKNGSKLIMGSNSEIAVDPTGEIIFEGKSEMRLSKGSCLGIFNGSLDLRKEAELDLDRAFPMLKRKGKVKMDSTSVLTARDKFVHESGATLRISEYSTINFQDSLDIVLFDGGNPVPLSDTRLISLIDGGTLNYTPTDTTNLDKLFFQHTWNALVNHPLSIKESDVMTIVTEDTSEFIGSMPISDYDTLHLIGNGKAKFYSGGTIQASMTLNDGQSAYIEPDSSLTFETSLILNENSKLVLDSGTYYHITSGRKLFIACGAELEIKSGAVVIVDEGATVHIDPSSTVIDPDAGLSIHANVSTNTPNTCGCVNPILRWVDNIDTTSVRLNWNGNDSKTYTLRYRREHQSSWNAYVTTTGTSATISNLIEGSHYVWEIYQICGSLSFVRSSFTTAGKICDPVSNLDHEFLTDDSVVLSWDSVANVNFYNLRYKATNASVWIYNTPTEEEYILDSSYTNPSTTYQWRVVTYCNGNVSEESDQGFFTTPSAGARYGSYSNSETTAISPNPFTSSFKLSVAESYQKEPVTLFIYNAQGVPVHHGTYNTIHDVFIDEYLSSGIYHLKLIFEDHEEIIKLIKE